MKAHCHLNVSRIKLIDGHLCNLEESRLADVDQPVSRSYASSIGILKHIILRNHVYFMVIKSSPILGLVILDE